MHYPWFVITGAPSSGKTTIVNLLKAHGYHTQNEVARLFLLTDKPAVQGQELEQRIVRQRLQDHLAAPRDRVVFFDRGIPDSIAYYRFRGYEYDALLRHSLQYAWYQAVFLLDPLPDVHHPGIAGDEDAARRHEIDEHLEQAYRELGLAVVRVPAVSPTRRLELIKREISTCVPIDHLYHQPVFTAPA